MHFDNEKLKTMKCDHGEIIDFNFTGVWVTISIPSHLKIFFFLNEATLAQYIFFF